MELEGTIYQDLARVEMNKILVIEDDPQLGDLDLWQEAYYHEIRQGYYDFDLARSGEEAIEKIKADKDNEIKFLVVDIRMPQAKIDGEGFLKWMINANLAKKFAIIVFTALPGKAGEILSNFHLPSWILAKGSLSEQLNQLKDLRALFKQAMNFSNSETNRDTNDVTNSSVSEIISDIGVIEKSLCVLPTSKLAQLHKISESLLNQRKKQIKFIRDRYLREWVKIYQEKGYFADLSPLDELQFLKWSEGKSSYIPLGGSSEDRTYYKLHCSSSKGRLRVSVPVAIADSFSEVISRINAEVERLSSLV